MWHNSDLARPEYAGTLEYSSGQAYLTGFTFWLDSFISENDFINRSSKYVDIYKRLKTENDKEMWHYLIRQTLQLQQALKQ